MKTFRFRLERLLQLRSLERDQAGRALAGAARALAASEQARERVLRSAHALLTHWDGTHAPPASFRAEVWRGCRRRQRELEAEIARLRRTWEQRREAYLEARLAHRVLEQLRRRRLERWREELARREQRELDEIYLLKGPAGKPAWNRGTS